MRKTMRTLNIITAAALLFTIGCESTMVGPEYPEYDDDYNDDDTTYVDDDTTYLPELDTLIIIDDDTTYLPEIPDEEFDTLVVIVDDTSDTSGYGYSASPDYWCVIGIDCNDEYWMDPNGFPDSLDYIIDTTDTENNILPLKASIHTGE